MCVLWCRCRRPAVAVDAAPVPHRVDHEWTTPERSRSPGSAGGPTVRTGHGRGGAAGQVCYDCEAVSAATASTLATLLHGHDPRPRILAVEPSGGPGSNRVVLYLRDANGGVTQETAEYRPWIVADDAGVATVTTGAGVTPEVQPLTGDAPLNRLLRFPDRSQQARAVAALRAVEGAHFTYSSAVSQYLTITGRTLFHDMRFEDLHRLQLDIETTSLQPGAPGAAVLLVSLTDSRGLEEVLTAGAGAGGAGGEAALLRRLNERLLAIDPDVIEGHNLIDFDLPYLAARAEWHGISLPWGRDGQPSGSRSGKGATRSAARILPSMRVHIHGRHVVDTFQQIQRYDSAGTLESYGLKPVIEALEPRPRGRMFVDRTQIAELWQSDPERLARYCLDDARDVRVAGRPDHADRVLPGADRAPLLPGRRDRWDGREDQCLAGAGVPRRRHGRARTRAAATLSGRLHRASRGRCVPARRQVRRGEPLSGGDAASTAIKPASDTLGVFQPLLEDLTRRRLDAKRRQQRAGRPRRPTGGLVLIVQGADQLLLWLPRATAGPSSTTSTPPSASPPRAEADQGGPGRAGGQGREIIEVDTDGVYFVAPPADRDGSAGDGLRRRRRQGAPVGDQPGPRWAVRRHGIAEAEDLLPADLRRALACTGSSLRSRRDERYLRRFVQAAAVTLINGSIEEAGAAYLALARRIQQGELKVEEFSRRESITGKTHTSPGLRRLAAGGQGRARRAAGSGLPATRREPGAGRRVRRRRRPRLPVATPARHGRRFEGLVAGGAKGIEFKKLFPLLQGSQEPPTEHHVQLSLFE